MARRQGHVWSLNYMILQSDLPSLLSRITLRRSSLRTGFGGTSLGGWNVVCSMVHRVDDRYTQLGCAIKPHA